MSQIGSQKEEYSSSEDLPYKFNGKQFDEETGLYYYGARYMNPMASIWYGVDPMYNLDFSVSTYIFCHNNPIKNKDINGMYGTEEEAKHAAKMYGANYSYAKDKKQWYVALDESKRGAYKSGGTLTRHFGEDDMKITYRHGNTFTVNYFGKKYDFPDDPVINPSQIPENFYFGLIIRTPLETLMAPRPSLMIYLCQSKKSKKSVRWISRLK